MEAIARRAEEVLGSAEEASSRVADELPSFARLLRREPRLRAALTDISVGSEARRELLRSVLADRVDPKTLELIEVPAERSLAPAELEEAVDDLAVRALLADAEAEGALEDV